MKNALTSIVNLISWLSFRDFFPHKTEKLNFTENSSFYDILNIFDYPCNFILYVLYLF